MMPLIPRPYWFALMLGLFSAQLQAADIVVSDPWIAAAPPGARVVAGFMGLQNTSEQTHTLVGISSSKAERVEIHQTVFSEGMARMSPQEKLVIIAKDKVTLEPGGYHLMLIRPQPMTVGDQIPLSLEFADGTKMSIAAEVRKRNGGGHDHHH